MEPVDSKPAQVNGVDKACFLGLPPELRIAIYELCLVYTGTTNAVTIAIRPGLAKIGALRWTMLRYHLQPKLLGVCRQIYQEAVPVLYGNMVFEARFTINRRVYITFGAAKASERQREAMKHIRHVELSRYKNQSEYFKLLQELLLMPNLRKVRVRPEFRLNFQSTESMSTALLPLLKKLNKQSENKSGSQSVDHIELRAHNWGKEQGYYIGPAFRSQLKDVLLHALA